MDIAIASTAGQTFHLLSPLVGFIYLLPYITGVEMGTMVDSISQMGDWDFCRIFLSDIHGGWCATFNRAIIGNFKV